MLSIDGLWTGGGDCLAEVGLVPVSSILIAPERLIECEKKSRAGNTTRGTALANLRATYVNPKEQKDKGSTYRKSAANVPQREIVNVTWIESLALCS